MLLKSNKNVSKLQTRLLLSLFSSGSFSIDQHPDRLIDVGTGPTVLTTLLAKERLYHLKDLFGILGLCPCPLVKDGVAVTAVALLATIEVVIVVEGGGAILNDSFGKSLVCVFE